MHLCYNDLLYCEGVPTKELRLPALQGIILLLPDEHREALQVLLGFLKNVAELSEINQVCVWVGVCHMTLRGVV